MLKTLGRGLSLAVRPIRLAILSSVFVVVFVGLAVARSKKGPRLLRWYLETSGGAFLKVGQLLSLRVDLLASPYVHELRRLLDEAPASPPAIVRRTIREDLGREVEDIFAELDLTPVASGSIAQVHRGKLPSGESVAVKLKRPNVELEFGIDMFVLGIISRVIHFSGVLGGLDVVDLVDELIRLTKKEFQFKQEAFNIETLGALMRRDDIDHVAPKVYLDRCGGHVITMEWFDGVMVADIHDALGDMQDPSTKAAAEAKLAGWRKRGIVPEKVAATLFRSIMEQCYHYRTFHADPHGANLVVLDGGTLAWVDFGIVGRLDEQAWLKQLRMFRALGDGKVNASFEALVRSLEPLPTGAVTTLEAKIKPILADWIVWAESDYSSALDKSNVILIAKIVEALRLARIRLPPTVAALYRALAVADMVIYQLAPDLNPLKELKKFFRAERERRISELFTVERLRESVGHAVDVVVTIPTLLSGLSDWLWFGPLAQGGTLDRASNYFDRAVTLGLESARRFLIMSAALLAVLRFGFSRGWFTGLPVEFRHAVEDYWWLVAVPLLVLAHLAGSMRRGLDENRY